MRAEHFCRRAKKGNTWYPGVIGYKCRGSCGGHGTQDMADIIVGGDFHT